MGLKVIGAGLGRTGTKSLQSALQTLLGEPCYHMIEVFGRPQDVPLWHAAIRGESVDWDALFDGYGAAVDWPACAFWRELMVVYPEAPVVLSTRRDADTWWTSVSNTIANPLRDEPPDEMREWHAMVVDMIELRFAPGAITDETGATAKAAYEAHNATVRAEVPADRLVDYQPGDGWTPLCEMLGVPEPDQSFPHENTTAEFREMANLPPI